MLVQPVGDRELFELARALIVDAPEIEKQPVEVGLPKLAERERWSLRVLAAVVR